MAKPYSFVAAVVFLTGMTVSPLGAQTSVLTCSNAGNTYKVGEFACIAACHGARRLARCDPGDESAIWTYVSDVCPSARFVPPPPAEASQIPVLARMTPLPGPLKISTFAPDMPLRLAALRLQKASVR